MLSRASLFTSTLFFVPNFEDCKVVLSDKFWYSIYIYPISIYILSIYYIKLSSLITCCRFSSGFYNYFVIFIDSKSFDFLTKLSVIVFPINNQLQL